MKTDTLITESAFISQESLFRTRVFMLVISILNYMNLVYKRNFSFKAFRYMTMNGWLLIVIYLAMCLIHTKYLQKGG